MKPKTQDEAKAINEKIKKEYDAALAKRAPEIKQLALQTKHAFESVVTPQQLAAYKALGGKPFVKS